MKTIQPAREITTWHFFYAGFLQREGEGGIPALWREAHLRAASPSTAVIAKTWRDDTEATAEMIRRFLPRDRRVAIHISAYSWGAQAAVNLCRELAKYDIQVASLTLCDPVVRHRYWLGNWRGFFSCIPLYIPTNVESAWAGCQKNNWPRGHLVIADDQTKTKITLAPPAKTRVHGTMDEWQVFHQRALANVEVVA